MAWTHGSGSAYTHLTTNRDVLVGNDTLGQLGAVWLRCSDKSGNVKVVLCSDPGGFNCIEAGIEGANAIVRVVTQGTAAAPPAGCSAAHGLAASVPFTMRVDLNGTILKIILNGVLPAALTVDLSSVPAAVLLLGQNRYGFTSSVNNALVLEAFKAPLVPNVLPALKVLVWVVDGDIWYATRDPTTGAIRAALAKSRALSATQPISTAEFQQKLYLCDGVGGHKVFDAATLRVSTWTRTGVTDPFYLVAAHQARVFGVATTDKQNLLASDVNDPDTYSTGSDLPGAAYGLSESNMPKIGEPIRGLCPATATEMIVFCARSVWVNRGDPALGGFSIEPIAIGVGGSGMRAFTLTPRGGVACHMTDGFSVIAGGTLVPVSLGVLTDLIQINRPLDDYTVIVVRDSNLHGCLIFLTPKVAGPAVHIWYDERTGDYARGGPESPGGFWPEDYPDNIGPTAACDWDGTIVLGGRDGYLRTYDVDQANHDGVVINWRLPLVLAVASDLEHDAIIQECTIVRGDGSSEFNVVFYGGRSAEEALAGDDRTLLARKVTSARQTLMMPMVRAPAVVIELSGLVYNTVGILEAVQVVTTPGAATLFARQSATDTAFGSSLRRGSTQNLGGSIGPGGGGGGGGGGGTSTGPPSGTNNGDVSGTGDPPYPSGTSATDTEPTGGSFTAGP